MNGFAINHLPPFINPPNNNLGTIPKPTKDNAVATPANARPIPRIAGPIQPIFSNSCLKPPLKPSSSKKPPNKAFTALKPFVIFLKIKPKISPAISKAFTKFGIKSSFQFFHVSLCKNFDNASKAIPPRPNLSKLPRVFILPPNLLLNTPLSLPKAPVRPLNPLCNGPVTASFRASASSFLSSFLEPGVSASFRFKAKSAFVILVCSL